MFGQAHLALGIQHPKSAKGKAGRHPNSMDAGLGAMPMDKED